MEYLIMWICTIIMSSVIEFSASFAIFKDVADQGYKVNSSKMHEIDITNQSNKLTKDDNSDEKGMSNPVKFELLSLLIPVYNVAHALKRYMDINNNKSTLFDRLNVLGILEKMSEQEQERYRSNPSFFNAFLISAPSAEKKKEQKEEMLLMKFKEKEMIGYVKFKINNELSEITIMDKHFIEHYGEELSEEDLKKIILDFSKKYENKESLLTGLNSYNENIDMSTQSLLEHMLNNPKGELLKLMQLKSDFEKSKIFTITEKKKKLLKLKRELVTNNYNRKITNNNKIITLKNKS